MMFRKVRRGNLYYADLNPVVGSEQGGKRPMLVIQNKRGNYHSPTMIVAPLSCNLKKADLPTHYKVHAYAGLKKESLVLLEQIRTIDKRRLFAYIGRLSRADMEQIDLCIAASFGFKLQKREVDNNGRHRKDCRKRYGEAYPVGQRRESDGKC